MGASYRSRRRSLVSLLLGLVFCLAGPGWLRAEDAPLAVPPIIQRNYDSARQNYEAHPDDDRVAWQFGHASFDRAEYARDGEERASLANAGIAACLKVTQRNPGLAEGHYYLGLNLAQLARTKMLGALPIVREMEREWLAAAAVDENLDYAGADRYVGLLYRDAPGRPLSVGNTGKARHYLQRAVELYPNFPENELNLIETYLMWKKTNSATAELDKLRQSLPAAHKEFSSEYWQDSWRDWNARLGKIDAALGNTPQPPPPAHKR